jgi:hypothetical protein
MPSGACAIAGFGDGAQVKLQQLKIENLPELLVKFAFK